VRALAAVPALTPAGRARALLFPGGHAVAPADDAVVRVVTRVYGLEHAHPAALRRLARRCLGDECGGNLDLLRQAAVLMAHHAAQACVPATPH
jgi:hypothetical protein